MLIVAMNFIFIACILYTVRVWSEKTTGNIKNMAFNCIRARIKFRHNRDRGHGDHGRRYLRI